MKLQRAFNAGLCKFARYQQDRSLCLEVLVKLVHALVILLLVLEFVLFFMNGHATLFIEILNMSCRDVMQRCHVYC